MSLLYDYLNDYTADAVRPVCIGVFDGVHRGHQALLARAKTISGTSPIVLTFDPHPAAVFAPGRTPEMLGTLDERAELLKQYGASSVVVARFDRAFAAQTPGEFIERVLVERLRAGAIVIGEDFRFGCDRTGNCESLRSAGARYGFTVDVVPPVFVNGVPARSTAIRQLLNGGKVEEASVLLGRPYKLTGMVVHGRKLGRTIGYPTANLETAVGIQIPAAGVYAGLAHLVDGRKCRTAISIGTNPTVTPESAVRTVEAFLMDGFDGELYDQMLSIEFCAYLRPTLKFDSIDTLITQMGHDVGEAARLLTIA